MGSVAIERGNFARGIAAFDAARRLSTDVEAANALAGRALAEARAHRLAEARATLRLADSLASTYLPTPLHTAVFIAQAYAALRDVDRAVWWLARYPAQQDLHYQLHIACDPPFTMIANDQRYRSLVIAQARIGAC